MERKTEVYNYINNDKDCNEGNLKHNYYNDDNDDDDDDGGCTDWTSQKSGASTR